MDWNSSTKMPPVNYLASEEGKPVVTSSFLVSIPSRLERVRRYLTSFIDIRRGEILLGFYLRAGAWIDGIEILTSLGRKSGVYGNAHGGSGYVSWSPPILWHRLTMRDSCRHTLIPPLGYKIAGISGSSASWVDGFSLIIMHWPLAAMRWCSLCYRSFRVFDLTQDDVTLGLVGSRSEPRQYQQYTYCHCLADKVCRLSRGLHSVPDGRLPFRMK